MAKKVIQPEINIGLVGHVDHGKTSLTKQLSGKWTDTHSEEIKRGITIRLGYADSQFYKTKEGYTAKKKTGAKFLRKVSFVDAPGHESLMATMLAGSTLMDGALLLISATEKVPQSQTREHVQALHIMGVTKVVVVQNKIDLISEEEAIKNHEQIKDFLKNTELKDAPIIPISAKTGANIDLLIKAIEKTIPTPKRNEKANPIFYVARSFDVNKPGTDIDSIIGGVLGGALKQGVLKVGNEIEIKPGRFSQEKNKITWYPITTKITGLKTGGETVNEIRPGGTMGILTTLDPAIVKSDSLTGSTVGHPGKLPPLLEEVALETHLLERVVGAAEEVTVKAIQKGEILMLNVNSSATVGIVTEISKNKIKCALKKPVVAETESRMTISRRVDNRFRLIGYGLIQ